MFCLKISCFKVGTIVLLFIFLFKHFILFLKNQFFLDFWILVNRYFFHLYYPCIGCSGWFNPYLLVTWLVILIHHPLLTCVQQLWLQLHCCYLHYCAQLECTNICLVKLKSVLKYVLLWPLLSTQRYTQPKNLSILKKMMILDRNNLIEDWSLIWWILKFFVNVVSDGFFIYLFIYKNSSLILHSIVVDVVIFANLVDLFVFSIFSLLCIFNNQLK